jgi:hypothetical protein
MLTGYGGGPLFVVIPGGGRGDRGIRMGLGWLLPDASYQVLEEGWGRHTYRPRHGRAPLLVRTAYSAATALSRARGRYLGTVDDDVVAGAGAKAGSTGSAVSAAGIGGAGAGALVTAGAGRGALGATVAGPPAPRAAGGSPAAGPAVPDARSGTAGTGGPNSNSSAAAGGGSGGTADAGGPPAA